MTEKKLTCDDEYLLGDRTQIEKQHEVISRRWGNVYLNLDGSYVNM